MRSRLEKTGMAEFNLDERDMAKDPQIDDIIASLNTFPMGAEFRLVILTNCDKLPKAVSEPLVEYFSNPSPTTVCLVVATSLAKNTRLYKAIKKLGAKAIIECAPKKTWEMPPQVVKMAAAHGKSMGIPAAEALVARSGENTRMLDNELKKLASMVEVPRSPWRTSSAMSCGRRRSSLGVFERRGGSRPCALARAARAAAGQERGASMVAAGHALRELIIASRSMRAVRFPARLDSGRSSWQVKNHLGWARRWRMDELLDALTHAVDVELAPQGLA